MTGNEIPPGVAAIETEAERAAAAKRAHEANAANQFALRLRRITATGADDGKGNCKRCGLPFEYDDEGRPMHAEPITACPVEPPPPVVPAPKLALVKDSQPETINRPRRVRPFGERDDD